MSRTPDYYLKALNKLTGAKTGKVGAGWLNEDGSISLVLDITIMPEPNLVLNLFPNDAQRFIDKAVEKRKADFTDALKQDMPEPGVTKHRIKK